MIWSYKMLKYFSEVQLNLFMQLRVCGQHRLRSWGCQTLHKTASPPCINSSATPISCANFLFGRCAHNQTCQKCHRLQFPFFTLLVWEGSGKTQCSHNSFFRKRKKSNFSLFYKIISFFLNSAKTKQPRNTVKGFLSTTLTSFCTSCAFFSDLWANEMMGSTCFSMK